jgi:hypothetical protein
MVDIILDRISVPVDGTTVQSELVAPFGVPYRIRLSGTAIYGTQPPNPATLYTDGVWSYYHPTQSWIIYTPIRLQINGSDVADQSFNPNHEYWFDYTGTGQPFTFKLRDTFYGDNTGYLNVEIHAYGPNVNPNSGKADCPLSYSGQTIAGDPIDLLDGDIHEEVTDLSLHTPAGPLTLVRSYSQKQQSEFQSMGLGWTHNHLTPLTFIAGSPNKITVRLPRGGEVHFTETTTDHYPADPGSASVIEVDPTSDYDPVTNEARYTLTATPIQGIGIVHDFR